MPIYRVEAMSVADPSLSRRSFLGATSLSIAMVADPAFAWASRSFNVKAGRFSGVKEGPVTAYKGIRYGLAERFGRAKPVTRHKGVIKAEEFGPIAPQLANSDMVMDEDCLFLNIWTPDSDARAKRPVMVYFHGGAYNNGTVSDPLTHGGRLAELGDVVVVTVNQRLNAFGYLYLDPLSPRYSGSGNNGQFDLLLALQWVRANIADFGGDADCVTVFGQSGGGAKIATMMAMPAASGLFHRAITMSGQQVTASGAGNALQRTYAFFEALKIAPDNLNGLRDLPWQTLVEALATRDPIIGGSLYFGPVMDLDELPRHPFWPDAAPQSLSIPMVLGNTLDETRAFLNPRGPILQDISFDNLARRIAPNIRIDLPAPKVVDAYRNQYPERTPEQLFYAITTDGRSWPGQLIEAEARARAGASETWVYRLDRPSPVDALRRAAHTDDLPYVFGTLDAPGSYSGTDSSAMAVRDYMIGAFSTFARTGEPKLSGLDWPRYDLAKRQSMLIDIPPSVASDARGWERRFWGVAPYIQPGI